MLALETVGKIQIDHLRDKVPIKAIARKRGFDLPSSPTPIQEQALLLNAKIARR